MTGFGHVLMTKYVCSVCSRYDFRLIVVQE